MKALANLISKRTAGHVRLAFATNDGAALDQLLARFGLASPEGRTVKLREITGSEACLMISALLRFDMAYHAELMSEHDAKAFAEKFLNSFPSEGTRFLTNRTVLKVSTRPHDSFASEPLTQSTFDAGVVCLHESVAGCIWFEDED